MVCHSLLHNHSLPVPRPRAARVTTQVRPQPAAASPALQSLLRMSESGSPAPSTGPDSASACPSRPQEESEPGPARPTAYAPGLEAPAAATQESVPGARLAAGP